MKGEFEAEQIPESIDEQGLSSSGFEVEDQLYKEPRCSFVESGWSVK